MFDVSFIIDFFTKLPGEYSVLFLSMIPITEIRVSIPIGIEFFKMNVFLVWIIAVIGDIIPAMFILYLLPKLHDWLIEKKIVGKLLRKKMEKAEKAFAGKYAKYGAIALITFVAIPLPFTGSWTGSLVAFIFNIPFKKSLPMILVGDCLAATIITLVTLFAGTTLRAIF
ncbi:MAG: small multi-drug export protein [Patescibacteria group bacterium]